MDFILAAEHLLRTYRERKEALSHTLAAGGAQDIEQYNRIVGEIAGLNVAEQELQTLNKNMEESYD